MRFLVLSWSLLAVLVVESGCNCVDTVVAGCTSGTGCTADGSVKGDGGAMGAGGSRGDAGARDGGSAGLPTDVVAVEVTPAVVTLSPSVGQRMTQPFTAQLVQRDGNKRASTLLAWSQDTLVAGDIDPGTGVFTTNGLTGSQVTVTASVVVDGVTISGTAALTVQVQAVLFGTNTPNDVGSKFTAFSR